MGEKESDSNNDNLNNASENIYRRILENIDCIYSNIDKNKYACIHSFFYDLCELVIAKELIVIRNDKKPAIMCYINNLSKEEIESNLFNKQAILNEIHNIPKSKGYKLNSKGIVYKDKYCIPVWFEDADKNSKEYLIIVHGSPLIARENNKPIERFSRFAQLLNRLVYYWYATILCKSRRYRDWAISIAEKYDEGPTQSKQEICIELFKPLRSWFVQIGEIEEIYHIAWLLWKKSYENDISLENNKEHITKIWDDFESMSRKWLCVGTDECRDGKKLCKNCKENLQLITLVHLIKWPLLYSNKSYSYINNKNKSIDEYLNTLNTTESFINKYKEEEVRNGDKRITLNFC